MTFFKIVRINGWKPEEEIEHEIKWEDSVEGDAVGELTKTGRDGAKLLRYATPLPSEGL